jgi:hypothetical protein
LTKWEKGGGEKFTPGAETLVPSAAGDKSITGNQFSSLFFTSFL